MAESFPDCGCETACPGAGGHGPVQDNEILRYFVTSRSDVDLKRGQNRAINSAMFKRLKTKGMSTVRLNLCDAPELLYTANLLNGNQVNNDQVFGGIVGVVEFLAGSVRKLAESDAKICCVLETPLENRTCHVDVVYARANLSNEADLELRLSLFNSIGGAKAFKKLSDVDGGALISFLPKCLTQS